MFTDFLKSASEGHLDKKKTKILHFQIKSFSFPDVYKYGIFPNSCRRESVAPRIGDYLEQERKRSKFREMTFFSYIAPYQRFKQFR